MLYKTLTHKYFANNYLSIYILNTELYICYNRCDKRTSISPVINTNTKGFVDKYLKNNWIETKDVWVDPSGALRKPPITY